MIWLRRTWHCVVRGARRALTNGRRLLFGDRLYRVERVDEEPNHLRPGVLYVIEDTGEDWAACMTCPGGCGQALYMNLLPDTKPVWQMKMERDNVPTLTPSVWRREGCGCHFNLCQGRIQWY